MGARPGREISQGGGGVVYVERGVRAMPVRVWVDDEELSAAAAVEVVVGRGVRAMPGSDGAAGAALEELLGELLGGGMIAI